MKKKFYKAKNDSMFKAIFCNENNRDLLERLIEDTIKMKVKIKRVKAPELLKKNIYVKGKTLDVLVSTDIGEINVEVNTYSDYELHRRNASYIFSRYSDSIEVGNSYQQMEKFIQINLTSNSDEDIPLVGMYTLMDDKTKIKYIDNLIIYEFNVPKIKTSCYNGSNEYNFVALLDADKEELENMCRGDNMMKKLKEEVENLNNDDEFVKFLSDEDEERLLKNTFIEKGYEKGLNDGVERGIKQGIERGIEKGIEQGSIKEKKNIALNMLNQNMDINLISNVTSLTKEEISDLK